MNICLLSKTYLEARGGIESYTALTAQCLADLGHGVHIVTAGGREETLHPSPGITVHRVAWKEYSFRGSWRIERYLPLAWLGYSRRAGRKIASLARAGAIDIVESPNWALEGIWQAARGRVPLVVRLHVPTPDYARLGIIRDGARARAVLALERYFLARADCLTAPSRTVADSFLQEYGLGREITVIPNSVDERLFFPDPAAEADHPTLLYVGRLEENKGIGCLCEALPRLREAFPGMEFIFVGRDTVCPRTGRPWSELLRERGGERTRHFPGLAREELAHLYRKCWVCVVPSLSEAFGLSALEAMACGRAVVAAEVGGLREIINGGISGLLVPPSDAEALAGAVARLVGNREYRSWLGKNARETVRRRYHLGTVAAATVAVYETALRVRARKRQQDLHHENRTKIYSREY